MGDTTLNNMEFPVDVLLVTLKENRENHKHIVKEAQEGYLGALQRELKAKLSALKKGKTISPHSSLCAPGDNTNEYDTVIEMLEMTTDEALVLNKNDFRCYVMDKWQWQRSFLDNASNFSTTGSLYYSDTNWD